MPPRGNGNRSAVRRLRRAARRSVELEALRAHEGTEAFAFHDGVLARLVGCPAAALLLTEAFRVALAGIGLDGIAPLVVARELRFEGRLVIAVRVQRHLQR